MISIESQLSLSISLLCLDSDFLAILFCSAVPIVIDFISFQASALIFDVSMAHIKR